MDFDTPLAMVASYAWDGICFSVVWHLAAFLTKCRPAWDMLEKL